MRSARKEQMLAARVIRMIRKVLCAGMDRCRNGPDEEVNYARAVGKGLL